MAHVARDYFIRQFDTAWMLASYHLQGLSTEECLWRPASQGLHVHLGSEGTWHADWPEHERYDLGPASIAWLTWHLGFWWSMALDHNFGDGVLARESVHWPGDADAVRTWLNAVRARWLGALESLTDDDLQSSERTRWPFQDRPVGDLMAWANVELVKNAAEIGYARFLYAVRDRRGYGQ